VPNYHESLKCLLKPEGEFLQAAACCCTVEGLTVLAAEPVAGLNEGERADASLALSRI
jgi:hypothetical protein